MGILTVWGMPFLRDVPQRKTSTCGAGICFLGTSADEYPAKQDRKHDSADS